MRYCRSCSDPGLVIVLDLGRTPLANGLLTAEQLNDPEPTYPLQLAYCQHCSLVQITETVSREAIFSDYPYLSSFSDTMLEHARRMCEESIDRYALSDKSLVIEIGSNDGYLLQYYKRRGIPVLGIEPARNVAEVAEVQRGIPTMRRFFNEGLARELAGKGEMADVVHANNVLAHVSDINGFAAALNLILKEKGHAILEVPYVRDLVENVEFDTIYHEHLCYFSLLSLRALFQRNGLDVVDVLRVPIHGGSLRIVVSRSGAAAHSVAELEREEKLLGMNRAAYYAGFAERVQILKKELNALLDDLKGRGCRIAAYGASAKSTTLLSFCGIGRDVIDFVADRSKLKQGKYTPGAHLEILPPSSLVESRPEYCVLLTWNFASEILEQQSDYRRLGGRFVIPVPKPVVI